MELLKAYPNAHIHAADVAPGMVSLVDTVVAFHGWKDRVETAVMDGMSLGYADGTFDASITNFGIFFFPDPVEGARKICRTLKPGGKAAVTCWKKGGGFEEVEVYEKEVIWWNNGIEEAAKGLTDNFVNMVGDQWTEGEKEQALDTTVQVLKEQGKDLVIESDGMIGFQMVAWIALATKEDKTAL
ncbi:MAG: hypothetical protein Q9187_001394 [Circinaria calcarea]